LESRCVVRIPPLHLQHPQKGIITAAAVQEV
jgi:hypothetical protein